MLTMMFRKKGVDPNSFIFDENKENQTTSAAAPSDTRKPSIENSALDVRRFVWTQ